MSAVEPLADATRCQLRAVLVVDGREAAHVIVPLPDPMTEDASLNDTCLQMAGAELGQGLARLVGKRSLYRLPGS